MRAFDLLLENCILWRPQSRQIRQRLDAFKAFPALRYLRRAVNGHGRDAWRSFHFADVGTDWKAVVHDQGGEQAPWLVFIDTSKRYSFQGRFVSFEKFLTLLPVDLQQQFQAQAQLFQP